MLRSKYISAVVRDRWKDESSGWCRGKLVSDMFLTIDSGEFAKFSKFFSVTQNEM
jgi:hypothetical protein